MEENKKANNIDNNSNLYIYISLIILGMAAIATVSIYIPILIFTIIFLVPFAMKYDMETAKPILSVSLIIVVGGFLAFNKFNYSIFHILAASTGLSMVVPFVIWRFGKIEKFSDGMKYVLVGSAFAGVMCALTVFLINGREPFSLQIVESAKNALMSDNSMQSREILNSLYNRMIVLENQSELTFAERMQSTLGILDYSSQASLSEKVTKVMPMIETVANTYSILAIILYPTLAGGIAWWRGSYRFYKNKEMTDSAKKLKPMPFAAFTIPRGLFGIVVLMLLISFILQMYDDSNMMMYSAMIMQYFSYMLLGLQGLAVSEYFLKRARIFKFAAVRIILMGTIGIISAGIFFMFLGMMDLFINIRLVYTKSKEMKEKMKKMQNMQQQQKKEEKNKEDEHKGDKN